MKTDTVGSYMNDIQLCAGKDFYPACHNQECLSVLQREFIIATGIFSPVYGPTVDICMNVRGLFKHLVMSPVA